MAQEKSAIRGVLYHRSVAQVTGVRHKVNKFPYGDLKYVGGDIKAAEGVLNED